MGRNYWGPLCWTLLHTSALLCKQKDNDIYLHSRVKPFIKLIWKILPCHICRKDAKNYLNGNNIMAKKNGKDIFEYTRNFHNYVNKKHRKREFTKQQVNSLYSKVLPKHIKQINQYTEYIKWRGLRAGISEYNISYYLRYLKFLKSYCKIKISV